MIFKKIIIGSITILRSIWLIIIQSFNKRETILYPDVSLNLSSRYRGRIILTKNKNGDEKCVACNLCSVVCPVGCISLQKSEKKNGRWYPKFFNINFSRCIFCGLCEEACPTTAIQLIPDFEMSEFKRKDLLYKKKNLLISGPGKYPDYDFYKKSGINFSKKNKKLSKNKFSPISVKNLLP
ncbi:NADH-quinone oxidoreductase subunit NuoI [Sodalis-like secondary symbiont of Drepanosiphum platanoidis]|uniref:NADH-quinone oxidoreductase subunit NuoI n=1 Tax=Sodalis-like secondary symbiont of Drepanosiphum platanoidis TaxID=2994493 RepID=UPI003464DEDA